MGTLPSLLRQFYFIFKEQRDKSKKESPPPPCLISNQIDSPPPPSPSPLSRRLNFLISVLSTEDNSHWLGLYWAGWGEVGDVSPVWNWNTKVGKIVQIIESRCPKASVLPGPPPPIFGQITKYVMMEVRNQLMTQDLDTEMGCDGGHWSHLGNTPPWLAVCLSRVWPPPTTAHWSMVTTWRGICFYCQAAACSSIPDQGRLLHCTQLNVSERVDTHWWTSLRKSFGNVWQCFGQVESGLMGQGENLSSKESKSETHRQLVLVLVTGSDLYFSSVYLYFIMVMDRNFTFYSEK